jgi:dipeptidyl aminopeptidase/acylaminoacyl peptidase
LRAGVVGAPTTVGRRIWNLVTFLQNTAPYRRVLQVTEYGDPDKALLRLSPTTYLDRVKAPLLLVRA